MLVSRDVLLIKPETTYNTDAVPVAANDAVLVENVSWSHEGLRMNSQSGVRASLAGLKQSFGGTLMSISFDVQLKGSGAAYSASVRPEVDAILRACGLGVTVDTTVNSETVIYAPVSSGHESVTVYYYQDGSLFRLTGCRGNSSFSGETGKEGMISVTLTGHTSTPTDAAVPSPTIDNVDAPVIVNGSFSVAAYSAVINALSFDLSNTIATPPDMNSGDGYSAVQITKRDISGSFDPEAVLVATHDFINRLRSGTTGALNLGAIGAAQYNRWTLAMPAIYYRDVSPGDRDGVRTYEIPYGAIESTTDDELSLLFN